jgi:hypothetical protein
MGIVSLCPCQISAGSQFAALNGAVAARKHARWRVAKAGFKIIAVNRQDILDVQTR